MPGKVIVGMSGGVDSSAAALILKNKGYDVIGITMHMWQETPEGQAENRCCGLSAIEDARRVAMTLDIPYYVMNFKAEFKKNVVDYFVNEYLHGRTPNPCIACNRYVKWEALLKRCAELGADYIATGHYARIDRLENGRFAVRGSAARGKDQTYALYSLTQEQLEHTLFPVGDYTKDEIRRMAGEAGLAVADKPDSQEICFVPDNDYASFIRRETARTCGGICGENISKPGNFVDLDGNVLGRHKGIINYTVGQRRGLELSMGRRVFVIGIRPDTNEVVIGENDDTFTTQVSCRDVNWMSVAQPEAGSVRRVKAKIRYNHQGEYCMLEALPDGGAICRFEKPVRAAAPGQAAVFYDGEYVMGGGTII